MTRICHTDRNKMVVILYTKFSNAFIYMNIFGVYCCYSFPWRLFQGLPFTISHYWFLKWLIVEQVKVIMLTYDDSIHSLICASPSCSVLCKTQLRGINLMPTAKPFYHNISLWNLSRFANVVHNASTVPLHEPGALILCKTCVTNLFLWVCPETLQAREIPFVHSIQLSNRHINSSTTMQNVKTTRVVYSKFQIKRINSSPPPCPAYIRQWIILALVLIMACRLFGAKPLAKLMLDHYQMNP